MFLKLKGTEFEDFKEMMVDLLHYINFMKTPLLKTSFINFFALFATV